MQLTCAGTCSSAELAIAGVPLILSRGTSGAAEIALIGEVRIFMICRFDCKNAFDQKGVSLLAKANRSHHNKLSCSGATGRRSAR